MLIQLWMAEGFLQQKVGGQELMENLGNEYFDDLRARGFFQERQNNRYGDIRTCNIHDAFEKVISLYECSVVNASCAEGDNSLIRHFSLVQDSAISTFPKALHHAKKVRTFISYIRTYANIKDLCPNIFLHFKCLRVLDLSNTNVEKVSSSIGNLKQLRYVNLSRTDIVVLPASVTSLHNLQTLKLKRCNRLQELPRDMRNLVNLRHFSISNLGYWTQMPRNIGRLSFLQTLTIFVVAKNKKKGQGIKELEGLNLLQGKLEVRDLENVKNEIEAKEANLRGKDRVRRLELHWTANDYNDGRETVEFVLKGLQPHPNLEILGINHYSGVHFPLWMTSALHIPRLFEMSLRHCNRLEHLSGFGQLPSLRVLKVFEMNRLKCFGDEEILETFPSLNTLILHRLSNLEEWVKSKSLSFSCLEVLSIEDCPRLSTMPAHFPSLKELRLLNCGSMIVNVIAMSNLTSLTSLIIQGFPELTCLPHSLLENCKHLRRLQIRNCHKIEALPQNKEGIQFFCSSSLESLEISDCPALKCARFAWFTFSSEVNYYRL
ncbi:hypothetical protein GIB67_005437 [Kingdonia uniflora]|uniref:Uncharacterized protein n=1 Tax=Kingdonia uniflora TaxID=39325 RepID=A0A7J7NHB6_9MAGN|nr:hypothetical protein GIB67_005437 [Kingdonia uniflora]